VGAFADSRPVCRPANSNGGVVAPGGGALDRVQASSGTIYDLAGNVSEWSQDLWNRSGEPCWVDAILTDPICTTVSPGDGPGYPIRGGSWSTASDSLQAAQRVDETGVARAQTGLRCARPAD
jgi:formylglycine-generating enzyme required for sulfatase activity